MTQDNAAARTLQTLMDAAVDGIIVIDEFGKIEIFNKAAEKMFGYQQAEVLGKNVSALMPEPDSSSHDGYLKNFLNTREAKIIGRGRDVQGLRRNGEVFPMNLAVGETRNDGRSKFVGLVRDLTQSAMLAEQFEVVNDELKLIFDEAPTGIIVADTSGRIINSNPWLTEFLGYQEHELANMNLSGLIDRSDSNKYEQAVNSLLASRRLGHYLQVTLITNNAEKRQVSMQLSLAGPNTSSQRLIALIIDRSEEIAKNLISEKARDQLAHSDRLNSLGEMASAIAHEINQPLTAINSYALASKRMIDSGNNNSLTASNDITDVLQKISDQAQRGAEIVRRIRGFATKSELHRTTADVNDCILAALEMTRFNADATGINLVIELSSPLSPVIVDEIQIQQVCINLIRNAIDAMAEAPGELRIQSRQNGERIEVDFADTGPGVSAEIVERLFQPFQSGKKNGLGLGLSISQKIIADHQGEMSYEPNRPTGSCFKFHLPIANAE